MKVCSTLTDDELVRLYEGGNDNAFDILLNRHQEKLFNYIFFLTHNEEVANDIFQDTFVRAITAIRSHNYEKNGTFSSWLMCICRHLVLDKQRHEQTLTMVPHEFVDEEGEIMGDLLNNASLCEPTVEDNLFLEESIADLRLMVDRLPKSQREIIQLRYYSDMSFKDIAKLLDISINTALGRVRYAILNLKKMYSTYNLTEAV